MSLVSKWLTGGFAPSVRAAYANAAARHDLLSTARAQDDLRLLKYGHKIFSQSDEDGILAEIFRRIGVTRKRFCEIGVGDGRQNNTLALLYQGWQGTWIEASSRRCRQIRATLGWALEGRTLALREQRVTLDAAAALPEAVEDYNALDLFSIDIDSVDWHVIRALPRLGARVVIVEYNARFAPPIDFVVAPGMTGWQRDDYFSASLSAWVRLMEERGYALVGCGLAGINAYFVRGDLVTNQRFAAPFTAENHYEPPRYFLVNGWNAGHPPSLKPSFPA